MSILLVPISKTHSTISNENRSYIQITFRQGHYLGNTHIAKSPWTYFQRTHLNHIDIVMHIKQTESKSQCIYSATAILNNTSQNSPNTIHTNWNCYPTNHLLFINNNLKEITEHSNYLRESAIVIRKPRSSNKSKVFNSNQAHSLTRYSQNM